ncbi:MAG TPA: single-stranded DNA-binding protein [Chlamydiales bacterium]|nr:single-stranded DNA-binding protein [Chlamydiales bacterium]
MNFINIAGHLGADPEARFTSSGKKVTTLRVATRTRKGQNEDTIWWRVTVWGEQFDKMISFLKKGSPVVVFGEIQKPEIFNDKEGKPQASMEITASLLQFSPFGKGSSQQQEGHQPAHAPQAPHPVEGAPVNPYMGKPAPMAAPASPGTTFDDEVPF